MLKYVIKDLVAVSCYLPYGIILGLVAAAVISGCNRVRKRKGKSEFALLPMTLFVTYALLVLVITFLSREGNGTTGFYLELFSSFGINRRNDAYIIENILLFVPLGISCAWVFPPAANCFFSLLLGLSYSFFIEGLQLITGRGVFQVDDILTNGLGMLVGCLVFRACKGLLKRRD